MTSTFTVLEESSAAYRAIITDEGGAMLGGSVLTSLTLTLYVIGTGGAITYVNGRNEQDVLNLAGVTVYDALQTDVLSDGTELEYNLKWIISPLDTTLTNANLTTERHIALFEWAWAADKQGKHEVVLAVKNLGEV